MKKKKKAYKYWTLTRNICVLCSYIVKHRPYEFISMCACAPVIVFARALDDVAIASEGEIYTQRVRNANTHRPIIHKQYEQRIRRKKIINNNNNNNMRIESLVVARAISMNIFFPFFILTTSLCFFAAFFFFINIYLFFFLLLVHSLLRILFVMQRVFRTNVFLDLLFHIFFFFCSCCCFTFSRCSVLFNFILAIWCNNLLGNFCVKLVLLHVSFLFDSRSELKQVKT